MKHFAFLLCAAGLFAAHAVAQQGNLDSVTCPIMQNGQLTGINGWAFTQAYVTAYVDVYDGPTLVQSNIPANQYRGDLQAPVTNTTCSPRSATHPTGIPMVRCRFPAICSRATILRVRRDAGFPVSRCRMEVRTTK